MGVGAPLPSWELTLGAISRLAQLPSPMTLLQCASLGQVPIQSLAFRDSGQHVLLLLEAAALYGVSRWISINSVALCVHHNTPSSAEAPRCGSCLPLRTVRNRSSSCWCMQEATYERHAARGQASDLKSAPESRPIERLILREVHPAPRRRRAGATLVGTHLALRHPWRCRVTWTHWARELGGLMWAGGGHFCRGCWLGGRGWHNVVGCVGSGPELGKIAGGQLS